MMVHPIMVAGPHMMWFQDSNSKESYDVTVADIDGDGDLDILEADQSNKIYWYENDGTPDVGTCGQ